MHAVHGHHLWCTATIQLGWTSEWLYKSSTYSHTPGPPTLLPLNIGTHNAGTGHLGQCTITTGWDRNGITEYSHPTHAKDEPVCGVYRIQSTIAQPIIGSQCLNGLILHCRLGLGGGLGWVRWDVLVRITSFAYELAHGVNLKGKHANTFIVHLYCRQLFCELVRPFRITIVIS